MRSPSAATPDLVTAPASPTVPVWEEVKQAAPRPADVYRKVLELTQTWDEDRTDRLKAKARKLMQDLGVTYHLYHDNLEEDHSPPFDLLPRIIDQAEWQHLTRGVTQRVKVWNAFLKDIYGHQEILKAGIIPFQLVYDDPHYLRPAVGLPNSDSCPVRIAAFDLARIQDGRWVVIEDHVSDFSGPSYAMQSRNVLSSVCPDLLEVASVRSVQDYPTQLLDQIQGQLPSPASEPRVVMLTSNPDHSAFYEHSLMARTMGIPLVRGNDLTVLNSRVYLRTIGGLEPIDVIYRRIEERWTDSMAFDPETTWGLPGLMACLRKATVTVVNSIGTSLGHNNAIAAFLPRLARFYFNESLILPTVHRLWCHDQDQLDIVLTNLNQFRIRHVFERERDKEWCPAEMSDEETELLRRRLLAMSGLFIAEPLLPLSLLPVLGERGPEKRHAGLRVFAWGNAKSTEMPHCALTRYATQSGSRIISSGRGGGIKDTWILGKDRHRQDESPIQVYSPQRRLRLNSRIADSLYWMGRYQCRAENTTRILKVLQQLQIEDHTQKNSRQWAALWEALARATGHDTNFFKRTRRFRRRPVLHYLLLDPNNNASVFNAIRNCRLNAQSNRESISPELWFIINRLYQSLQAASQNPSLAEPSESLQIQELIDEILNQMDALTGAASQSMLRDDGFHFWHMGMFIERALSTLLVTRQVFMKRQDEETKSPRRDESNLDALLRMLACQYAYRSLFQTRPMFRYVAALVLQDPQMPRSVLFCLQGVREALESVFGNRFNPMDNPDDLPPLRQCSQLISEVEFADLSPYFSDEDAGKTGRLRQWMDGLADKLGALAERISDYYLYHQNFRMLS